MKRCLRVPRLRGAGEASVASLVEASVESMVESPVESWVKSLAKRSGGPLVSSRGSGAVAKVAGGSKLGAPAPPPASGAKSAV